MTVLTASASHDSHRDETGLGLGANGASTRLTLRARIHILTPGVIGRTITTGASALAA